MDVSMLKTYLQKEEAAAFRGWDFSYLEDRWRSEALGWDYREVLKRYLKSTDSLLDMGTGGGEFLLRLGHPHRRTAVTEGFCPAFPDHDLVHNRTYLESAGFTVLEAQEAFVTLEFFDLGAVAYYAKLIPWEFPGFSVERDFQRLLQLQCRLEKHGAIASIEHRFLLVGRKQANTD